MKIVTIGTLKGGVGKTTTVYNLSGFLASEGKSVLLIDADPQGNISENFRIGQDFEEEEEYNTLSDLFEKGATPEEIIVESVLDDVFEEAGINEVALIDLIPSTVDLTISEALLQIMSVKGATSQKRLLEWITKHRKELESKYDYIICDVGPNLGLITQNCLFASDEIYLVTDIGLNAFKGAKLFLTEWEKICDDVQINNNIKGIIVNKFDRRTKLSQQFLAYLDSQEDFKELVFKSLIPEAVAFKHSEIEGIPMAYFDKTSKGYIGYKSLLEELRSKELL